MGAWAKEETVNTKIAVTDSRVFIKLQSVFVPGCKYARILLFNKYNKQELQAIRTGTAEKEAETDESR